MSKKMIVLIILLIIFGGYLLWQMFLPYNTQIYHFEQKYDEMSKPEYLQTLKDFCKNELNDSIDGLNYSELVVWEHKYLEYSKNLPTDDSEFVRPELPIAILKGEATLSSEGINFFAYNYNYTTKRAMGRCGEFALLYNGLCLANGYKTRLIFDESILTNQSKSSAGDHVWVEVWVDNRWVHIDPTEQRIDEPKMYAVDWNKEINNVVAITKDDSGNMVTIDVTKNYQ